MSYEVLRKKTALRNLEKNGTGEETTCWCFETINIKDVIYMVAKFFEEVPCSRIVKSWRKTWPIIEKAIETNTGDNPLVDNKNSARWHCDLFKRVIKID